MSLVVWMPLIEDTHSQGLIKTTITNSNGTYSSTGGKLGGCYGFNSNGYLLGNNSPVTDKVPNWSFACWIKFNNATGGDCLFSSRTNISDRAIAIFRSVNRILFDDGYRWDFVPSISIPANTWTHLCFTREKGVAKKLYINGVLSDSQNISSYDPLYSNSNYFSIAGKLSDGSGNIHPTDDLLNGYLNDVRIYDHCLSEKEVKEISRGLVAHYTLDNSMAGQENLLIATSMTANERTVHPFINSNVEDWSIYFRYYNGSTALHSFSDDIDEITLNSSGNLGIAFQRKATDINLDTSSYYTLSCEAKCNRPGAYISIARSYYNSSNNWIWRGGENTQAFNNTIDWQKFSLTFIPDADTQYIMYNFTVPTSSPSADYKFWIRHCKLEKGAKATPYTLNSNDADYTRLGLNSNIEYESSGYTRNGTRRGAAFNISPDSFRHSNSLIFNGADNSINIPFNSMMGSTRPEAFTVNCWFYKTSIGSQAYQTIIGGPSGFELEARNNAVTDPLLVLWNWGKGSTPYEFNKWNMVTFIWTPTVVKLYLNGEYKLSANHSAALPTGNYLIGGWWKSDISDVTQEFEGRMSDFRIYTTELSVDDIKELYQTSAIIDNKGSIHCYEFIET